VARSVSEDELTSVPSFAAFSKGGVQMSSQAYLLADQPSELERLQLQSRLWEPSGRRLLDEIGEGRRPRPRRRVRCDRVAPIAERVGRARRPGGGDRYRRRDARGRRKVRGHGGPRQRSAHEGRPLREQAGVVATLLRVRWRAWSSSSGNRSYGPAETSRPVVSCLTCSAASVSKGTSAPRSWRFLRDIPTCGCRSSSPPPWKSGCYP
jgi:hypothetical protein